MDANAMASDGALKRRLDSSLRHFPVMMDPVAKKNCCCQLHRLANSFVNKNNNRPPGSRSDVYVCGDCGVALCIKCWNVFHTKVCFSAADYEAVLAS